MVGTEGRRCRRHPDYRHAAVRTVDPGQRPQVIMAMDHEFGAGRRDRLAKCDGVIVGTAIKRGRRAGGPVDPKLAKAFARAVRNVRSGR